MLLVFVAAGPAFAVLINFQRELRLERVAQARGIAQQQADLVSASLGSAIDGTREMMVALASANRVRDLSPGCLGLLTDLRRQMAFYTLVAVVGHDGTPACSDAAVPLAPGVLASVVQPLLSIAGFAIGGYTALPGGGPPMLTFAQPFSRPDGSGGGLVIAGLDLARLGSVLAAVHRPAGGRLVVGDRQGRLLAIAPADAALLGTALTAEEQTALGASLPGSSAFAGKDGSEHVIGYIPPGHDPAGLLVYASFDVGDLVGGIDHAARRGYVLILLGAALSILLALVIGHRYLRVPASVLLEAARRWGTGDLSARAVMPQGTATEFAGLGGAFNEMAELLQQQRAELQGLNEALELRVAQRTRALLDSNNRLQVEIAERELTEASLRQAQKLQAVGELAGGMAHDFNNLLTAILGSLELLRKRIPAADGRQGRLLDTATQAVERGSRLTAQLLAFSRKQPLIAVSVNVAEAIGGMAGLLSSTLGTSIRLETRIDEDLWPATLDPNQFEASILNLALNARDAMPSGGRLIISANNVTLTPASPWSELAPGDYVAVTVADSGAGMSDDVANRAFEPFYTTKEPGKGSGLGLSQVHGMVRQSGGSVTIQSRPADGTTVRMLLPRSLASPVARMDSFDSALPALGRTEAVLLVDDDEQVREVTQTMLEEAGYTVIGAQDGAQALEMLDHEGSRIGLVIADFAMPGITGRELLEIVRQRWPGIAVILATGYADLPELSGQDLPIDQIIRKPFRSNELLTRIHMVVQRQADSEQAKRRIPAG